MTYRASERDGAVVTVGDVKLWDKMRALELLATYLGLLKKQVEHSGGIDLVTRLRAARQRGRAAQAADSESTCRLRAPPLADSGYPRVSPA